MSNLFYTQVPYVHSHGHFSQDYVQGFPDLHAHGTFEDKRKTIREQLKYQLLTTKPEDAKNHVILRECFKFNQKRHVEFCLKQKAPGVSLQDAAKKLGYRKI